MGMDPERRVDGGQRGGGRKSEEDEGLRRIFRQWEADQNPGGPDE